MKKTLKYKERVRHDNKGKTVLHVVSEPGDHTRYDYFVYKDGPDEFCFMPCRSTFKFPQRLNYYDCQGKSEKFLIAFAKTEDCNYHTIMECIRTMEELHK